MRKYSKMNKGAKDKSAGSPGENGGGQNAENDLHSRTGRDETKRKTQERMERRNRSAGSEKMERVGDRQGKVERYCSTGQSPQQVVAPMEEEECNIIVRYKLFIWLAFVIYQLVINVGNK
jgi:hypothetical protein